MKLKTLNKTNFYSSPILNEMYLFVQNDLFHFGGFIFINCQTQEIEWLVSGFLNTKELILSPFYKIQLIIL